MTRLSILILSVLVITFLCVINVSNIHANDSVYVENEEHGQPPNTANHIHHYVHSPPKPFDRKFYYIYFVIVVVVIHIYVIVVVVLKHCT